MFCSIHIHAHNTYAHTYNYVSVSVIKLSIRTHTTREETNITYKHNIQTYYRTSLLCYTWRHT